jgi:hypothetical protein
MTFEEILDQATAMLQRRGRLTYGALKRQFQLDDAALQDLKEALLFAYSQIADEADRGLVCKLRQHIFSASGHLSRPEFSGYNSRVADPILRSTLWLYTTWCSVSRK